MAAYTIPELVRLSQALLGIPEHIAAGGLSGQTGSLTPAEATSLIEAWLGAPLPNATPVPAAAIGAWRPSVATAGDLPSSGNGLGDVRLVRGDHGLRAWIGVGWAEVKTSVDIDVRSYGFGTAIITPDDAITTAIAANPSGGTLKFPAGTYTVNNGFDLTAAPYNIDAAGQRHTVLQRTVSSASPMFTLWRSGNGAGATIRNIHLRGPGVGGGDVTPANVGSAPAGIGVVLRDQCSAESVTTDRWNTGIVLDGNHHYLKRCWSRGNKWAIDIAHDRAPSTVVGSSQTHGDLRADACDLTNNGEASINISGHGKIDSAVFTKCHFGWAPKGIQAQAKAASSAAANMAGPSPGQDAAAINTTFVGCSNESVGKRYMDDLGYNTANRRLWKGLRFIDQHDGPFNPAATADGVIGTEMIRLGLVIDWEIRGLVGDASNATFPIAGSAGGCGFLAEKFEQFTFFNIDQLWSDAAGSGRPIFRCTGSAGNQFMQVQATFQKRFMLIFARNSSGGTLVDGKIVQPAAFGEFWGGGFGATVQHAVNTTTPPIGRVAGGGPLTNGNLVPVVVYGQSNQVPCTDGTVAAGSVLTVDVANSGVKRKTLATEHDIGVALNNPAGGVVECIIRGALQPVL